MKMQNQKTPDANGNKNRYGKCRHAQQPQQNPGNFDTNEVCKVYKCSASFIPPLSTFREFYPKLSVRDHSQNRKYLAGYLTGCAFITVTIS